MAATEDYDVGIVGYGPAGLAAASLLGAKGHRVVVFERHPGLYGLPRLTHIDGETARILQSAADVDHALRDAHILESYEFRDASGEPLLTLPWKGAQAGHPAHISMFQPDIEDAMDARVGELGNVHVRKATSVTGVDVRDDGVHVEIQASDGTAQSVKAAYLVAADGANSTVREAVGITRTDHGLNERWLNIDTLARRALPERLSHTAVYLDPARPYMFMPIGQKRQRFEFQALPHETLDELEDPARAWRWLEETHGLGPDDVEIIRQVLYPIRALTADSWSAGNRVFLVGDAAHTMPPTMGQGACSAMRDSANLAWKLDLVLREVVPDDFLATYELERRPHAEAVVAMSVRAGHLIYETDRAITEPRDAALRQGNAPALPPFPTIVDGTVAGAEYAPSGTVAPQGRVAARDGRRGRFDDVFGHGFRVVTRGHVALSPRSQAVLAALGATTHAMGGADSSAFDPVDDVYPRYFADNAIDLVVVRPDFVVFGGARAADADAVIDALDARLGLRVGDPVAP
ncbi:bifunctional 3-(3-hydroxy-phenyl)propionate/3-hydroxycinnamic acid hydroxylase [Spirillospora sp. CA-255316]